MDGCGDHASSFDWSEDMDEEELAAVYRVCAGGLIVLVIWTFGLLTGAFVYSQCIKRITH